MEKIGRFGNEIVTECLQQTERQCGHAGVRLGHARSNCPTPFCLFICVHEKLEERPCTPGYSCSCFCVCPRRLPLSSVLQVYGIGWDWEAPADVFQQDAPHIQQYDLVLFVFFKWTRENGASRHTHLFQVHELCNRNLADVRWPQIFTQPYAGINQYSV